MKFTDKLKAFRLISSYMHDNLHLMKDFDHLTKDAVRSGLDEVKIKGKNVVTRYAGYDEKWDLLIDVFVKIHYEYRHENGYDVDREFCAAVTVGNRIEAMQALSDFLERKVENTDYMEL